MNPILEAKNLSKAYGAVKVADDLSYSLQSNEALGVIGPNGAGKTTMFNLIAGTQKQDSGHIIFCGKDISKLPAARRCQAGISRSFQIPQPFGELSVFENVYVAATQGAKLDEDQANDHCLKVLVQTGLINKANYLAGALTLLDRKRLELARTLCAKPKVLLLDEIAGGLTDQECHELIDTINAVRETGVSIIWIEHIVHALMSVVDRMMVINFGQKIADGNPKKVMASKVVQQIYMGID